MNLEWRVIKLESQSGEFNTLLDEVLLESAVPTILFTTWKPTVSIGRNQSYSLDVDNEFCKREGISTVRRKSGGQAVYLDEDYLVISAIAPQGVLPSNVTLLSQGFGNVIVRTLQDLGISAVFSHPTDIIINENKIKQIGNCANHISNSNNSVFVHGSIRYSLSNFDKMINALKVNGHKLHDYSREIKGALASVSDYTSAGQEEVISLFLERFTEQFGGNLVNSNLFDYEIAKVKSLMQKEHNLTYLKDEETYISKGICYLHINGKNLVQALAELKPIYGEKICQQ